MGIELLLVREGVEMGLDSKRDYGWRTIGQVLLERLGIYAGRHAGDG